MWDKIRKDYFSNKENSYVSLNKTELSLRRQIMHSVLSIDAQII